MNKIKAIISDIDGTLVDTLYMIRRGQYEAAMEYFVDRRLPRQKFPSYEVYEDYLDKAVGGSTRATFEATITAMITDGILDVESIPNIDYADIDRRLRPIQDRLAPLFVNPFYGLNQLFEWIGKSGLVFGLFSGASDYQIVRNFGISLPTLGYVDLYRMPSIGDKDKRNAFIRRANAVYGFKQFVMATCDDVAVAKPNPEAINKVLSMLNVAPEEAIVLGNHTVDVETASGAGVRAIALTHGFSTKEELMAAQPVAVANDLFEVVQLIEAHNSGEKPLY